MVIYNVNEIDPILVPILRNDFILEGNLKCDIFLMFARYYQSIFLGSRKMIQIADRLVDYNENFQLYLFSSSIDLTLSSDQSVLLTIVNFTLNHIGLTEQVYIFLLFSLPTFM